MFDLRARFLHSLLPYRTFPFKQSERAIFQTLWHPLGTKIRPDASKSTEETGEQSGRQFADCGNKTYRWYRVWEGNI
jgi:hypothetical protein